MNEIRPPGGVERRGKGGWDEVLATDTHLVAPGAEWRSELYRIAVEQFERAADALGLDPDILAEGERCASTSNRNFEGRQGKGGRTHLVSPRMAAAAAVEGRFVDIRDWDV